VPKPLTDVGWADPKAIGAGLGLLGIIAMALAGYVTITTPAEQQCQIQLADAKARLDLYTQATTACKDALDAYLRPPPSPPLPLPLPPPKETP